MSEYYDALASAIANLKPADQAARYAFYDRARKLVLQRLQAVDPPMADAAIRTEMSAFNAAVRQLEDDILRPQRQAPPAPPPRARPTPAIPAQTRPAPARSPQTPSSHAQPSHVNPSHVPPVHAPSLEIPREFVGEALAKAEPIAVSRRASRTHATEAPIAETAPGAAAQGAAMRQLGIVVGIALLLGILAAGVYALWGRQAPIRTAARPAASTATAPARSQNMPQQSRITVRNPERLTADADNMPYILRRQLVYYRSTHPPGTLVISKSQNFLYVVRPNSTAMRYTVAMGPDTAAASGLYQISRKENANDGLYLGDTNFRIKQSNAPITIGRPASAPGFQLVSEDFGDLFEHTEPGTRVVVTN